jgi:Fe-S-cluster containining protein
MDKNPPSFECTMCGECCRRLSDEDVVILFPQDIARISSRLDMDIASFRQRYVRSDRLIIDDDLWFPIDVIKDSNGRCPFLLDNNLCSIHDFKPIQCARAPFGFFWDSSIHNQIECVRKADVPIGWTSYELDKELIDLIVNNKCKEANTYDGSQVKDSEHY